MSRADVHLCKSFSGGLPNDWVPSAGESFQRDWSEEDMLKSAAAGGIEIKSYVFLECFNRSPADEAKWVQSMVDDPNSKCAAFCAQIYAQHGAAAVTEFLDAVRDESGALPSGLRGARMVFPASDNNAPDACLDPKFHEGLEALQAAGLLWEFCCNPTMAPNLYQTCSAKTCTALGWTGAAMVDHGSPGICGESNDLDHPSFTGCSGTQTFARAVEICEGVGARRVRARLRLRGRRRRGGERGNVEHHLPPAAARARRSSRGEGGEGGNGEGAR